MTMIAERIPPLLVDCVQLAPDGYLHRVDRAIQKRLATRIDGHRGIGRLPIESVSDAMHLDVDAATMIYNLEDIDALDTVSMRDNPSAEPLFATLRQRCGELLAPMTLQQALVVAGVMQRFRASNRALAEIVHGMFSWAAWHPTHNQLVGRHLWLLAQRRIAIALGAPDPYPKLP